jgi:SPP1 gp7 family putative phage head morphogenesis protein
MATKQQRETAWRKVEQFNALARPAKLRERDPRDRFQRSLGAAPPAALSIAMDAARPRGGALPPVRPNVGVQAVYRKRIARLVDEMDASVRRYLLAAYRKNEPAVMAMDATPAAELQAAVRALAKRWVHRFDEAAPALAEYFGKSVERRSSRALAEILRRGGFTVEFRMTAAMRDVLRATVAQNVALIRSIPSEYFTQIEGAVMRSVQSGRDLASLAKDVEARYGVTKRRAALIARTQNNMATASMTRVRQVEAGITEAIWQHSHGGKEPRPTHLANSGKTYDPAKGWYDPDPRVRRRVWPGELINCRCVTRAVVKGFS